ncbi:MAG: TonB-dependent receptor, partial [bacterium]|nr:TonB-dependent receptor [bacterium]
MSQRDRIRLPFICLLLAFGLSFASAAAFAEEPEDADTVEAVEAVEADLEVADEASVVDEDEEEDAVEETAAEGEEKQAPSDVVMVTANRRKEDIQDAALSVTALSATFIEDIGLTDFTEMQKFTPNLLITPSIDSRSTGISIRGIGNSGGANAGIDPTVAVFVDGVYQGRAGMSVQDLLDVQSIEILRGPQGTLYGKNTAAGAIKVETKDPGYDPELSLEFVGGDYMDFQGRFSGNYPIVEDLLATRTSGYVVFRDGYETNRSDRYDGDDMNNAEKWGLRNKTLVDVTDDWAVLLSGDFSSSKQRGYVPIVTDYSCKPVTFDNACKEAADQGITLDKNADHTTDYKKDRDVYTNVKPKNDVVTAGTALEITHERWDHEFTSLTSYRNYTSDSFWDGDFSELDVTTWDTEVELHQVSSELRAASPAWDLWNYVAGVYFYYADMQTDDTLLQTKTYWSSTDDQATIADNEHRTTSAAGYADADFNLGELWGNTPDITFTTGIRVGWERKGLDASHRCRGPLCAVPTPISGEDSDRKEHTDDTYVTFREVLKYEPVENVMVYASYASGYKSGGYNQLRQNPDVGQPADEVDIYFSPEKSKSWEVGVKTTWL